VRTARNVPNMATRTVRCLVLGLMVTACSSVEPTPSPEVEASVALPTTTPTEEVTVTVEPSHTVDASQTVSASPTVGPTPVVVVQPGTLPPGSEARVVVDGLRLRSEPGVGSPVLRTLPQDAVVYLAGPPFLRIVDGSEWRLVMYAPGFEEWPQRPANVEEGWVATGDADGPYLALEPISCPAGEIDVQTLGGMTDWARLACLGNRVLSLEDTVQNGGRQTWLGSGEPAWLLPGATGPQFNLYAISTLALNLGYHQPIQWAWESADYGKPLLVTAHFDDAEAQSCVMSTGVSDGPLVAEPDTLVILYCRERLVATAADPVGD